jgi:hypothetical protein
LDKRSRFIVEGGEDQRNWSEGQKEFTCPFAHVASLKTSGSFNRQGAALVCGECLIKLVQSNASGAAA